MENTGKHTYEEKTYAVFGDVHAHLDQFVKTLRTLGWDPSTFALPKNLTIIQAGDLIHKGPATNEIVKLVDSTLLRNSGDPETGDWVQLMGNHESQYFRGTALFWKSECSQRSIRTLHRWMESGDLSFAYLIPQDDGKPYVVTHGGVNPFWYYRAEVRFNDVVKGISTTQAILNEARIQRTPENFVSWMNSLSEDIPFACRPGVMLRSGVSSKASPVWALSSHEVYSKWREAEVPFHQIHGHAAPYMWKQEMFYPNTPLVVQRETSLFPEERRSVWRNTDGAEFHCIDNGFEDTADREYIQPMLMTRKGIIPFKIR